MKAFEAEESVTMSEQGKFLRQTFTEFHTFALVAAGYVADAVEHGFRDAVKHRDEPFGDYGRRTSAD